jgi:hypothetical protein
MAEVRETLQQRKLVLNWYCKPVSICEVQGCWGYELVTEDIGCDKFMTESVVQEGYKQRSWRKFMFRDFYMQWLRMILTTGDTSQVSLVLLLSTVCLYLSILLIWLTKRSARLPYELDQSTDLLHS